MLFYYIFMITIIIIIINIQNFADIISSSTIVLDEIYCSGKHFILFYQCDLCSSYNNIQISEEEYAKHNMTYKIRTRQEK